MTEYEKKIQAYQDELAANNAEDANDLKGWREYQAKIQAQRQQSDSPWLWMQDKLVEVPIWANSLSQPEKKK